MDTNGEATTPQETKESSENNAVEIMTGTGMTAADLESQILAEDADEETIQDGGGDESTQTDEEDNQNAEEESEAGEENEENADDNENEAEEDDDEKVEDKDKLSPEHQAILDKRIGKEVAKRKTLEEDLEKERSESARLKEQLESLTDQLEKSDNPAPSNTHPLLLVESEKDIEAWEEKYWEFKRWAKKFKDGYSGHDAHGNEISYTSEDIAARLDNLTEEKERYLPKARDLLSKRAQYEGKVKEVYPELFNRGTSEYREMLAVVNAVPAIKQLPDYKMVVGDIIAGRKARQAKQEEPEKQEKKKEKVQVKLKKQPPKVPVHNAPGKAGSVSASAGHTANAGINTNKLVEMGGSMDALEELIYQSG